MYSATSPAMVDDVRRGALPAWLAGTALLVNLVLSKNSLFLLGINYDTPGGSSLEKLHPGTYLAVAAFAVLLARESGVQRRVRLTLPGAGLFLALIGACMMFQIVTGGADHLVVYLESFLPAGLLGIVTALAAPRARRNLVRLLLALFLLNVAIAVTEAVQHRQWIPIYLLDRALLVTAEDFRPTALYDHPLTAAAMTAIGVFLSLALPLGPMAHGALLFAFALGLLAFGGRAAILVCAAVLAVWGGVAVLRRLLARRLPVPLVLAALGAAAVALLITAVLLGTTGLGARAAGRFYWDDSAAARGVQWQMLAMLDTGELLFGAGRDRTDLLVANLGLRYPFIAVENFWLVMLLDLGLFGIPLFLGAMATLLLGTARRVATPARVMLIAVMVIASASNTLGRKSAILTVLVPAAIATTGFAGRAPRPMSIAVAAPVLRHAVVA